MNRIPYKGPRDYQEACLLAVIARAAEPDGLRQAVQLPTGAGKTIVFAELLKRRAHLGRALVLAHRDELIAQAVDKIQWVAPGMGIGVVKAERYETGYAVTVASMQTLQNQRRIDGLPGDYATVIIDEAHHADAPGYRRIIDGTVGPQTLILGVSATLERTDRHRMDDVFTSGVTFTLPMFSLIHREILTDVVAKRIMVDPTGAGVVRVRGGDYVDSDLEHALHDAQAPAMAVSAWAEHAEGRHGVLFAPTVASAEEFRDAFVSAGYRSEMVWGAQDKLERRAVLRDFDAGNIDVLANCMVLTEGWDSWACDALVMARSTRSAPLYTQMLGRGLRPSPEGHLPKKQNCLVLDLIGVTSELDLVTTATLLGVDAKPLDKVGLVGALEEVEEAAEQAKQIEFVIGRLVAKEIDLFAAHRLHWGQSQERCYTLTAGIETVVVLPEKVQTEENDWLAYAVVAVHPGEMGLSRRTWRYLERGLPIDSAQVVAEEYVRQNESEMLNDSSRWRSGKGPASDAQRRFLDSLHCDYDPRTITKAGAAEMITDAKAAQIGRWLARQL